MALKLRKSWLIGGLALLAASAAQAEAIDELDQALGSSAKAAQVLDLARQQAAGGQLLEALASSERALFLDSKSQAARLLHATLLCRLDDPRGAAAEFSLLKQRDFKKADWQGATAHCPALFTKGAK